MRTRVGSRLAQPREMTYWLDALRADIVCGLRGLRRAPGLTATVVVVLGGAIGLNATLLTVAAGIAWRPWSGVSQPGALVRVYAQDASGQASGLSLADARLLSDRATSLQGVGTMRGDAVDLAVGGQSRPARALMVSGNLFDLLGVAPAAGRRIVAADDRDGQPAPVAMLAYTTWQRSFGANPAVVGSPLAINGVPFTVVGIVSSEFESAEPAYDIDVYLPSAAVTLIRPGDAASRQALSDPRACCADVVARLRPGVTPPQAAAELAVLAPRWTAVSGLPARGAIVRDTTFIAQPGRADSAQAWLTVTMLAGGLVLVWLIACANIGNLLLARAVTRMREMGTRAALGASRGRLVTLLLTEGATLGVVAAAAGVAIATQLPHLLFRLVNGASTRPQFPFSVAPDVVVLGCVVAIGLLSALAFSLAPALIVTGLAKGGAGRDTDAWTHRLRLRSVLLGVQVAVSVTLLASAGLLARGVQRGAASFDPGFRIDGITALSFALPERTYDRARATALFDEIANRVPREPGTTHAFSSRDPFSLYREGTLIRTPGEPLDRLHEVLYLDVSPAYFPLMEIPIRAGRGFDRRDVGDAAVVINEAMAQAFWPGVNPIGETFVMRRRGPTRSFAVQRVVGVARNVSVTASTSVRPMFYRAVTPGTEVFDFISQDPRASQAPVLLLRGSTAAAVRVAAAIARLDERITVTLTPLSASMDTVRASMKWGPILAATLGGFALALTTVGLFGVFAYAVQRRTREIGVRMALGAPAAAVVRLIVVGHSRAVLVGIGAGLAGAVASSFGLRARLFGLSPLDPVTYAGVALLLACCGLLATYAPVRRAIRISPVVALRSE
jgi:predicted permease